MSTDYIELIFKNGSVFQILTLGASSRGQRATGGIMEEAALIDGTALAEVIIPMMNIPRMTSDGGKNDEEPHSQQIYIKLLSKKKLLLNIPVIFTYYVRGDNNDCLYLLNS